MADYRGLLELRARADVLIHGRKTATWTRTVAKLGSPEFQRLRQRCAKERPLLYVVVSAHPNKKLLPFLVDVPEGVEVLLATTKTARITKEWRHIPTIRLGTDHVPVDELVGWLGERAYQNVLVEGGPTLLRHFLDSETLDELFLTIAPKIFGGDSTETLGLTAGPLYPASGVPGAKLLNLFTVGDELYLRYQIIRKEKHES